MAAWLTWGANEADVGVVSSRVLSTQNLEVRRRGGRGGGGGGGADADAAAQRMRGLFALTCFVFIVWGWAEEEQHYAIYLTNQSYNVLFFYFLFAAYLTHRSITDPPAREQLTGRYKVVVYLWEHSFTFATVVSVNYWIYVFSGTLKVNSVFTHGVNFGMCLAELAVNKIHFVRQHVWLTIGAAVLYVIWALFYKVVSSDWIYESMSDPAVWVIVSITVALSFFLGLGLTRLRERRYASYAVSRRGPQLEDDDEL